ncbi:MAG TPA: DUF2541 family protein [Chryseolinea sp.]|nr:DUF2541 family protein [Chryseolinea sp.]HPM30676.1 DUF2541 family protein [Chryseolinea sp.]
MAFMIVMIAQFSFAQTEEKMLDSWKLLGTRVVDYTIDRDVVTLNPSKIDITGLKFIVKNGKINMHKATIHFAIGDKQEIDFADQVNATNDGRIVELKGNSRAIEKVTFWYDTKNGGKDKATVEVWGK